MTALRRVRSVWSGFAGAPGVTTMYFLDTNTCVPDLRTMWQALQAEIPGGVSIQVENVGDIIEDTTGALLGTWPNVTVVAPVTNVEAVPYSGPSGAVINWRTDTVVGGHRIRGRSFVVPLRQTSYAPDGTLENGHRAVILQAATNFANSQISSFVIWQRPRLARAADGSRPAVTARAGSHGLVTSVTVPDKACVLRSRRD